MSAENIKAHACISVGKQTRMSANTPKVDWEGGAMGAFICVSGLILITASLISASQRRRAWKDAT